MTNSSSCSSNTQHYLNQYQHILNEMIDKMSSIVPTGSISGDFIRQMIPHHLAAIEMSENLLCYTTNIPLQRIARNIISSQKKSIENMTEVCPVCQALTNPPKALTCYQQKNRCILKTMFQEMNSACADNCIDANFMREMIPHHRGAVMMSENALCFNLCPELVPLLREIITSQKKGICEMQLLLRRITC